MAFVARVARVNGWSDIYQVLPCEEQGGPIIIQMSKELNLSQVPSPSVFSVNGNPIGIFIRCGSEMFVMPFKDQVTNTSMNISEGMTKASIAESPIEGWSWVVPSDHHFSLVYHDPEAFSVFTENGGTFRTPYLSTTSQYPRPVSGRWNIKFILVPKETPKV